MEIMNQLENLKKIAKTKLAKNDPAHDFEPCNESIPKC